MKDTGERCRDDCPRKRNVFRLLVFAQFAIVAVFVVVLRQAHQGWVPWLLSSSGVGLGVWALLTMGRYFNITPSLKTDAPLRVAGPYRIVRHPMYLALLIFCGAYLVEGITMYSITLWLALLFVLLCKIYYEEQILRQRFSEYEAYTKNTKRIIPYVF